MLAIEAEFPHVGSMGWLKPDADRLEAEPVRILQRCSDGRRLIARTACYPREACTANLRVSLDALAATREEATPKGPVRKPYRKARR